MNGLGVARCVVNASRRPELVAAPAGPEVLEFHRRLPGYGPTPLHRLDGLALEVGVGSVHLKDESDRLGLPAFKILGASWAVERTLRERPGTRVLVTASSGNHGRAVARVAAQRSLGCRVFVPASSSPGRASLIEAEGAKVVRVDGAYEEAVALAAQAANDEPDTALVADTAYEPVDGPPAWVTDGYSTLFREVTEQASVPFDMVLVPGGVGSFAAAAVHWAVHAQPFAAVVVVEPATAACIGASLAAGEPVSIPTPGTTMAGLDCATPSAVAWPTLRDGLAGAIAVSDDEAHRAMRDLAAAGLTVGDCGAATLAALRALVAEESCAPLRAVVGPLADWRVLLVSTEGATDPEAYRRTLAEGRVLTPPGPGAGELGNAMPPTPASRLLA